MSGVVGGDGVVEELDTRLAIEYSSYLAVVVGVGVVNGVGLGRRGRFFRRVEGFVGATTGRFVAAGLEDSKKLPELERK